MSYFVITIFSLIHTETQLKYTGRGKVKYAFIQNFTFPVLLWQKEKNCSLCLLVKPTAKQVSRRDSGTLPSFCTFPSFRRKYTQANEECAQKSAYLLKRGKIYVSSRSVHTHVGVASMRSAFDTMWWWRGVAILQKIEKMNTLEKYAYIL